MTRYRRRGLNARDLEEFKTPEFAAGRQARLDGRGRADNPHKPRTEKWMHWDEGFRHQLAVERRLSAH